MINRLIAIVLLIALASSNFSRVFVYAGFEMNQKYIATTLCENRDKPEMHCNGKCYLAKKLKQAEEKEKRQEANHSKKGLQDSLFSRHRVEFSPAVCILKNNIYPEISFPLPQSHLEILDPPPSLCS